VAVFGSDSSVEEYTNEDKFTLPWKLGVDELVDASSSCISCRK
jgi:hypothetical protein